jgi:hypothetical protein
MQTKKGPFYLRRGPKRWQLISEETQYRLAESVASPEIRLDDSLGADFKFSQGKAWVFSPNDCVHAY